MVQFTETHVLSTQTSKGNSQEGSQPVDEPDLNQVWRLVWLPEVWQPGWRCLSGEQPSGLPPQMGPAKSMLSSKTIFIACSAVEADFIQQEIEPNQESLFELCSIGAPESQF